MPLASALQDVKDAVDAVNLYMTAPGNGNAALGEQWAYVGEAFFKNGLNPAWTPAGLAAGRAAFAQAFGASLAPDPAGAGFALAIQSGLNAFAGQSSTPANAAPGIPGQLPPIVPPPAPPGLISIPPPGDNTVPLAVEIFAKANAWAPSGLVSVTTPGGPVPTTPWS